MAQSEAAQLVTDLGLGLLPTGSGSLFDRTYQELLTELAWRREPTFTNVTYVQTVRRQGLYPFPTGAVRILAVAYERRMLFPARVGEARSFVADWQTAVGTPQAWVIENESAQVFRVLPQPETTGAAIGSVTPLTGPPPPGALTVLYTTAGLGGQVSGHAYEELLLALGVLARDFGWESPRTDPWAAGYTAAVAELVQALLRLQVR
jgi:hypothetical protein